MRSSMSGSRGYFAASLIVLISCALSGGPVQAQTVTASISCQCYKSPPGGKNVDFLVECAMTVSGADKDIAGIEWDTDVGYGYRSIFPDFVNPIKAVGRGIDNCGETMTLSGTAYDGKHNEIATATTSIVLSCDDDLPIN